LRAGAKAAETAESAMPHLRLISGYNLAMEIQLNGKKYDVPDGITVKELIALRQIKTSIFAVERNRQIVPRQLHDTTRLAPGDQVEIAVAVGGG
jgi:sulfur carrier protein